MPLRVKCRCGQELVLRFNEWIYALVGLIVLCLLVNGTALGIIVYKLSAIQSASLVARSPSARELPGKDAPREEAGEQVVDGNTLDVEEPAPAKPPSTAAATPTPSTATLVGAGTEVAPAPEKPLPKEAGPQVTAAPESERQRIEVPRARSGPAGKSGAPTPPGRAPLPEGASPLERLMIVGRSEDPRLLCVFLEDQEPAVRRTAAQRFLTLPKPDPATSRDLLVLALPAAPLLLSEPPGRELLQRLAGEDRGGDANSWWEWGQSALGCDPRQGPSEEILRSLSVRAEAVRASSPAIQEISKALDEKARAAGTDLLLCIDSSESMEEPLKALSRDTWIFPALASAIPGLRMGLLFYTDEVTATLPLGTPPKELARALSALKAEGGGDVPEGVHEALKAALQLGRFDWRPEARKRIIFVGDGPPPRVEVPGLLSLARECRAEGGYHIDALSVNPLEGQSATLHFPELAAAGEGRAVTAGPDRIAAEIFLSLFPPAAFEELNRLLPVWIAAGGWRLAAGE